MAFSGRMGELIQKYDKVALDIHFSIYAAFIVGLYASIKNNVDMLHKVGLSGVGKGGGDAGPSPLADPAIIREGHKLPLPAGVEQQQEEKNRMPELVASSGRALVLAILYNKALFPVWVLITIALTLPVARFLWARNIIKSEPSVVLPQTDLQNSRCHCYAYNWVLYLEQNFLTLDGAATYESSRHLRSSCFCQNLMRPKPT